MKFAFFALPYHILNLDSTNEDIISIINYLGYNSGNLLFRHGTFSLFKNHSFTENLKDSSVDIIILPLANQIGLHNTAISTCKFLFDTLSQTNKPIIAFGLGSQIDLKYANELNENIINFLKLLSKKSHNIHVRDDNTRKILNHFNINNVVVSGCPSFLLNRNFQLGQEIFEKANKSYFNINVSYQRLNNKLTKHLFNLKKFTKDKFSIIIQENNNDEIINFLQNKSIYSIEFDPHFKFFYNLTDWYKHLLDFDLHIGTRIHNSILNILCGNFSICITHDVRTENLCKTLHIPNISETRFIEISNDFQKILKEINFDFKKFNDNREILFNLFENEIKYYLQDFKLDREKNLEINHYDILDLNQMSTQDNLLHLINKNKLKEFLPNDFKTEMYKFFNPDLNKMSEKELIIHYLLHGKKENRLY